MGCFDVDKTMIIRASSQMISSFNPGLDGFSSVLLKKPNDVIDYITNSSSSHLSKKKAINVTSTITVEFQQGTF